MKKILLSLTLIGVIFFGSTSTVQAKAKESNRIIRNVSEKVYVKKVSKIIAKLPPTDDSFGNMHADEFTSKELNHNKMWLYRTSAHKKYLMPLKKVTWGYMQDQSLSGYATVTRVAKIKRPAIYFEIKIKINHKVKHYWVWHNYTGGAPVINTFNDSDWPRGPEFINHPDPF